MRRTIGLLLASGLAMLVAGCASTGGGGATAGGTAATSGGTTAAPTESMRNFNLRVKCPGVHTLKLHGWTDQQIQAQLSVEPEDIAACEKWVAEQPKGYVPPPPPGVTPKKVELPAAQASPAAATGTTAAAPAPANQ
jgi:hypothetical protein